MLLIICVKAHREVAASPLHLPEEAPRTLEAHVGALPGTACAPAKMEGPFKRIRGKNINANANEN